MRSMDDLISRQAVIEALLKCGDYYNGNEEAKRGVTQCIGTIYDMPAVEKQIPQKPVKEKNEYTYRCPKCDSDVVGSGYYCWKCGQCLKWEDDDNDRSGEES